MKAPTHNLHVQHSHFEEVRYGGIVGVGDLEVDVPLVVVVMTGSVEDFEVDVPTVFVVVVAVVVVDDDVGVTGIVDDFEVGVPTVVVDIFTTGSPGRGIFVT